MPKAFYPNECYVCGVTTSLRRCSRCHLISYCGEVHQKNDWTSHKTFCSVISMIMRINDLSHLYENSKGFTSQKWIQERMNMIKHVSSLLDRNIQINEIQMLTFPRSCIVCHDTKQENLTNCPHCPLISFCKLHSNTLRHNEECLKINACYNFEIDCDNFRERAFTLIYKILDSQQMELLKKPTTIDDYLNQILDHSLNIDDKMKKYLAAILAPSLTIFNSIEKLNYQPSTKLTININTRDNLNTFPQHWEILLHLLPNLKYLKIILDNDDTITIRDDVSLCKKCTTMKRKLITKTLNEENCDDFGKFDLSFFSNLNVPDNWDIEWELVNNVWKLFNCPIIFMISTEIQMKRLKNKLKHDNYWKQLICFDGSNDFAPATPYRSTDDWTIVEDKKYLLILNTTASIQKKIPKNLSKTKSETNSSNKISSLNKNEIKIKENNVKKDEIPLGINAENSIENKFSINNEKMGEKIINENINYMEIKNLNETLIKNTLLLQEQIDNIIKENINLKEENQRLKNEISKN
ncbi:uncharacterized protein LOC127281125 [Leptopilina boulardi]|uniref:uncharacterized protein LOC127281125 n=1 Tax=Leptopilina boulardi TaxID=63433 RepID=UPI0021F584A8|nr:uncharacterized protein LOC127281125 [Leptopilina boulardi]